MFQIKCSISVNETLNVFAHCLFESCFHTDISEKKTSMELEAQFCEYCCLAIKGDRKSRGNSAQIFLHILILLQNFGDVQYIGDSFTFRCYSNMNTASGPSVNCLLNICEIILGEFHQPDLDISLCKIYEDVERPYKQLKICYLRRAMVQCMQIYVV